MSLSHRHGWLTVEDAERSKVYLANPGAVIVTGCRFCDKVHVDVPAVPPARLAASPRNSRPTALVRRTVLERDGWACVCCGTSIIGRRYSLGHRLRASQGGKAVPSNLLTFLGWGGEECHGRIDLYKDPVDAVNGYRVESWQDPALLPVKVFNPNGLLTVWLAADGTYSLVQPDGVAA